VVAPLLPGDDIVVAQSCRGGVNLLRLHGGGGGQFRQGHAGGSGGGVPAERPQQGMLSFLPEVEIPFGSGTA